MALLKTETRASGVTAGYHRVRAVHLYTPGKGYPGIRLEVESYVSKELREQGADPLPGVIYVNVPPAQVSETFQSKIGAEELRLYDIIGKAAYDFVRMFTDDSGARPFAEAVNDL